MLLFIRISSLDEQILCRISSFYCIPAYDMRLFKILRDDMHEGKNKLLGIKLQI